MKKYVHALRAPFLTGSIAPVIIGTCLAISEGKFFLIPFLVTIVGVSGLHLGANLLNDFYDARGSDPLNIRLTPFSGGSRVIQEKQLRPTNIMTLSIAFFILALGAAIWLVYEGKYLIIPLGLLGLLAGWSYSAPPLQLMSKGWGELAIFFAFGPLVTLGSYYVMTDAFTLTAFMIGFPQGFLITAVIWINQFPDYEADRAAGKKNLVVKLGPGLSRYLYSVIMLMSFAFVIFLISILGQSYLIMISFISIPLAIKAMIIVFREYLDYEKLIPAQALTINTLVAQGLLLSLGLLLSR
ncbi:MAG: 1,4-dihydroxy-2-naphthoate octaprenyltransferase [Deltaproteobacteria bacterium]|nr:1,4-dihydroxy-2-naphthoate octaprenyltransferase [Deltaproteobacteria bacterium]